MYSQRWIHSGIVIATQLLHSYVMAQELPMKVVGLDSDLLKQFETGPHEDDSNGPKVRCDLINSFLFGSEDHIISQIQRHVHEGTVRGFTGFEFKTSIWTGEAIIAISPSGKRDRMLILTEAAANESNIVGSFAYSPVQLGIVLRTRNAADGQADEFYKWDLQNDSIERSDIRSRLWRIQAAIDHSSLRLDETAIELDRVGVSDTETNTVSVFPVDKSIFDLVGRSSGHSDPVRALFLPTDQQTSFISVNMKERKIECIDPTCDKGRRWIKGGSAIEAELSSWFLEIYEIVGESRPAGAFHLLFDPIKRGKAIYTQWSTETGDLERLIELSVGEKWGGPYCDKPSISRDGRWLSLISKNSDSENVLRIYDLENNATYVEMPRDQLPSRFSYLIGIRNNENVVLQSDSELWEIDLSTAHIRKQIFGLPRKMTPRRRKAKSTRESQLQLKWSEIEKLGKRQPLTTHRCEICSARIRRSKGR